MRRMGRRTAGSWALMLVCLTAAAVCADDWPQWLGPKRDGVWRETGIIKELPKGGPPILWRKPVAEGYAGPAVAGGRVFLTDWVRKGTQPGQSPFQRGGGPGKERVLCFDAKTGKPLWEYAYDCKYAVSYAAGPRATPTVEAGKVYALGTMGDLNCLDAQTGKEVWKKNFVTDYKAPVPVWGFAAAPLIVGDALVCLVGGEGNALVVAFDKNTGKELWKALSASEPGYCPPTLVHAGGKAQLIVWDPDAVHSLDPATGKEYWSVPFKLRSGLSIPTPRVEGNRLFLTAFYNGSLMLELDKDKPAVKELWRIQGKSERPDATKALHSIMPTPVFKDGYIYGIDSYGELRCLKADTGERLWSSLLATSPKDKPKTRRWGSAFLVEQGDRFFLFNERGELIIARLTPKGYEELGRTSLLEPTNKLAGDRPVVWMHPAFADRCIFARNDKELLCASLAEPTK